MRVGTLVGQAMLEEPCITINFIHILENIVFREMKLYMYIWKIIKNTKGKSLTFLALKGNHTSVISLMPLQEFSDADAS